MNKLLKEAQILLRTAFQFDLSPPLHRRIENFLTRNKPKRKATSKSKGGRLRREKKRAAHNDSTKVIRERVFGRAGDVCEACHTGFVSWGATMDHWSSGSGKSQRQAVENCWVLCGAPSVPESCHYLRQRNLPSVELWNNRFAAHAAKYGYPPIAHITHAQLKRSAP